VNRLRAANAFGVHDPHFDGVHLRWPERAPPDMLAELALPMVALIRHRYLGCMSSPLSQGKAGRNQHGDGFLHAP